MADRLEKKSAEIYDEICANILNRLLELTNTISKTGSNKQVLDKLKVERERGITVKAQVRRKMICNAITQKMHIYTDGLFIDCIHVL